LGSVVAFLGFFSAADDCVAQDALPETSVAVEIEADQQEQLDSGDIQAAGYVTLRAGNIVLTSDEVEYRPETGFVVAKGNVVFQKGEDKVICRRMEMDLHLGTGVFDNASGYAGRELYFHAEKVIKESDDVYVIENGAFTSCAQPDPRWQFTAGKARVHRDRDVRLRNVFLKVKSVPVLYSPFLVYPIEEDERATGFLMPRFGSSSTKGILFSESFFWALNRSMDATFTLDTYSEAGLGGGGEYRYVLSETSRGDFRSYVLRDETTGLQEYTLDYSFNQDLPGGFRTVGRVDYFSSFDFQSQFQEGFNDLTQRSKRVSGSVSRSWSNYNFRLSVDRNETAFSDNPAVRQILPELSLSSRQSRLGTTPLLFSFQSEASRLSRNYGSELAGYERINFSPTLAYPFTELSFLTFKTSLTGGYTHYTSRIDESGDILGEGVDRTFYQVQFDMRGPMLARIFNTPGNSYAERYKHVIEPQVVWTYRSPINDYDSIPKFDYEDYLQGANQLSLSLVNRFLAKQESSGDRKSKGPLEFLTWTLSQKYYLDANDDAGELQNATMSAISSRLRFRPYSGFAVDWNVDYDAESATLRSLSLAGVFSGARWGTTQISWNRTTSVESEILRNYLRAVNTMTWSGGLKTNIRLDYNVAEGTLNHLRAGVSYEVQCCGFSVDFVRYKFDETRDETQLLFGITLANVGSFGGLLGGKQ
jgi:LPS-assembly protein